MAGNLSNDPLHGVSSKKIVTELSEYYGFDELGLMIKIRCFTHDPSVSSSFEVPSSNTLGSQKKSSNFTSRVKQSSTAIFFTRKKSIFVIISLIKVFYSTKIGF